MRVPVFATIAILLVLAVVFAGSILLGGRSETEPPEPLAWPPMDQCDWGRLGERCSESSLRRTLDDRLDQYDLLEASSHRPVRNEGSLGRAVELASLVDLRLGVQFLAGVSQNGPLHLVRIVQGGRDRPHYSACVNYEMASGRPLALSFRMYSTSDIELARAIRHEWSGHVRKLCCEGVALGDQVGFIHASIHYQDLLFLRDLHALSVAGGRVDCRVPRGTWKKAVQGVKDRVMECIPRAGIIRPIALAAVWQGLQDLSQDPVPFPLRDVPWRAEDVESTSGPGAR